MLDIIPVFGKRYCTLRHISEVSRKSVMCLCCSAYWALVTHLLVIELVKNSPLGTFSFSEI